MANFFSADYWKALYFKAMGGQETAVDPNAMSGSFAGSASFTGTLDLPEGFIAGSFAGSSAFDGELTAEGQRKRFVDLEFISRPRRKLIEIAAPSLQWVNENFAKLLGPNADRAKLDELLAAEKRAADEAELAAQRDAAEKAAALASAAIAQTAAELVANDVVVKADTDLDEDTIIALLLAA